MEVFVRSHDLNGNQSSQIMVDNFTFHGMGGHTLRRDRQTRNEIVMECAIRDKEKVPVEQRDRLLKKQHRFALANAAPL